MVKSPEKIHADQLHQLGLPREDSYAFTDPLNHWRNSLPPVEVWNKVKSTLLKPSHPFAVHQFLFQEIYKDDKSGQPPWAWIPGPQEKENSNIAQWMKKKSFTAYRDFYQWSVQHSLEFWREVTSGLQIKFHQSAQSMTTDEDFSHPQAVENPQWFPGARLNIVESCFQSEPEALAIVFRDEEGRSGQWTYGQLRKQVHRIAASLKKIGIGPGDRVGIDMTLTAEAVALYLAIIQRGAAVVSIADSFAADEIQTRLKIANAQWVFTQDMIYRGGKQLPLYEKVLAAAAQHIVVLSGQWDAMSPLQVTLRPADLHWKDFLTDAEDEQSYSASPLDTINVLFSSGTTGDPKAIPWNHCTAIKAASDGYFHLDIHAQDRVAWPTNLGWMMGPWLIFASLVNRATIALFYGAPAGRNFGEFISQCKVTMLGLVPSIVKTWRASRCMEGLDWSNLRCLSSTGEVSNPDDYLYLMYLAQYRPIIEYCGGTEIGGGFVSGSLLQNQSPSTFSSPCLGLKLHILDEQGKPASQGELFIQGPSLGLSQSLLNKDHHQVYFAEVPRGPGGEILRRHGDQFERLANGYFRAHGRADDTMNLGGIKTSSAEIERVLNRVPAVRETAAIAVPPPGGGPSLLVIYVVLHQAVKAEILIQQMQNQIRDKLNPLFKIHDLRVIESLPRTASNKVMRRVLRAEYLASRDRLS